MRIRRRDLRQRDGEAAVERRVGWTKLGTTRFGAVNQEGKSC